ncbi:class I SAM-dependent methyltransferase [Candidatus Peregrinibacteria bacterium]|nr:class I SAM-dependent methyltransferase [Candidatus Peregrinibacteria bacterium]
MKPLDPKTGYDRYAAKYDTHQTYWDSFEQRALRPYFQNIAGKKVLDAGAGTGRLSIRLHQAGADVTAIDCSTEMLARLHKKCPAIQTVEGDMEAMPFPDNTFDMVFSSLALVHLKNVEPFLEEAYRVLKDSGTFVLVNIHYRKAFVLKDKQGSYTIECYNHFPRHVREAASALAFRVENESLVTEGNKIWNSQVLVLRK